MKPVLDRLEDRTVLSQAMSAAVISTPSDLSTATTKLVGQLVQGIQAAVPTGVGAPAAVLTSLLADQINGTYGSLLKPLNAIPYGINTTSAAGMNALFAEAANNTINGTQLAANEMLTAYVNTLLATGQATTSTSGVIAFHGQQFTYASVQNSLNAPFGTFRTNFLSAQNTLLAGGGASNTGQVINTAADLTNYTNQLVANLAQAVRSALAPLPGASSVLTPNMMQVLGGTSATSSMQSLLNDIPYTNVSTGVKILGVSTIYAFEAAIAINNTQLAENEILTVAASTLVFSGAATSSSSGVITAGGQSFSFPTLQGELNAAFKSFRSSYFADQKSLLGG
jgi:hypothetical protein